MPSRDANPKGYKVRELLSRNVPEKPVNYVHDLDLQGTLEDVVATIGYDIRIQSPSHSVGHVANPEWGRRLASMYREKGQVLALLHTAIGILSTAEKADHAQDRLNDAVRGARKGKIYKSLLFDAVGKEAFQELVSKAAVDNPELFAARTDVGGDS